MPEPIIPSVYNATLAKKLQSIKKDLGAKRVYRGYRGTGSKSHRYQIWVEMSNGRPVDLWLEADRVTIGGICQILSRKDAIVQHNSTTDIQAIYKEVLVRLKNANSVSSQR